MVNVDPVSAWARWWLIGGVIALAVAILEVINGVLWPAGLVLVFALVQFAGAWRTVQRKRD